MYIYKVQKSMRCSYF